LWRCARFKIIIAGAGGAAHRLRHDRLLDGTSGVRRPVESKALSGVDSLYSIVSDARRGSGRDAGPSASPAPFNAALLAASVLALNESRINRRLVAWRKQQTEAVNERPEGSA